MNDENNQNTATYERSSKDKKKELPTLPAETSIEDTKEKKVVVVKPGEPDVKISDTSDHSQKGKEDDNNLD
jgi:hypothetical protein